MESKATEPVRYPSHLMRGVLISGLSYVFPAALLLFLLFGAGLNFSFLWDSTNWDIGSAPIAFAPSDPYWRAFLVGLLNTLLAGGVSILLGVLLGFTLSILRMSGITVLAWTVSLYCDVIRNIPVILQAMFWYAVFLNLPNARNAIEFAGAFVSNRGIYIPWTTVPLALPAIVAGLIVAAFGTNTLYRAREKANAPRQRKIGAAVLTVGLAFVAWGALVGQSTQTFAWPEKRGLSIVGGLRIQVEFVALVAALVLYRAAYISETFRAGFKSVPPGQIEAARSIGLNAFDTLFYIRLPQALVTILPPLSSECVLIMKITSIGLLLGFGDLYSISVSTSTLTNRSLEAVLLLVIGYLMINLTIVMAMNWANRHLVKRGKR